MPSRLRRLTAVCHAGADRRLGLLSALLAVVAVLSACQKPAPDIGVLSGSIYRTVSPSTYCFNDGHCRAEPLDFPAVNAAPDAKVLIDVPRQVEGNGWEVRALSLDGRKLLASSGRITDSHSYQVASTVNGGRPFIVQVVQLSSGQPDNSRWSFLLQISGEGTATGA